MSDLISNCLNYIYYFDIEAQLLIGAIFDHKFLNTTMAKYLGLIGFDRDRNFPMYFYILLCLLKYI